jgi:Icc-related predicted phosphoesterase
MIESETIVAGGICLRILVTADFHGNIDSARLLGGSRLGAKGGGEVDAIVICGDLSEFGSLVRGMNVLKEVQRGFDDVFFVTGNHDPPSLMKYENQDGGTVEWSSKVTCLHGKAVRFRDITLVGLSGFYPPFYGEWDIEGLPLTQDSQIYYFLNDIFAVATKADSEDAKIILVTHEPPYGVADLSVVTKRNEGSRSIRDIILKWKPVAAFCGHIHEGRTISKLGETLIVNPGSMSRRLAARFELEKEGEARAELIRI